jgi:hypothetical protein
VIYTGADSHARQCASLFGGSDRIRSILDALGIELDSMMDTITTLFKYVHLLWYAIQRYSLISFRAHDLKGLNLDIPPLIQPRRRGDGGSKSKRDRYRNILSESLQSAIGRLSSI